MSLPVILLIVYIVSALIVALFCKVLHYSHPEDNALHWFLIVCPIVNTGVAIVYMLGDMWWIMFLWWDD